MKKTQKNKPKKNLIKIYDIINQKRKTTSTCGQYLGFELYTHILG